MSKFLLTLSIVAAMCVSSCTGSSNTDSNQNVTSGTEASTFDGELSLPNGTPGLAKRIIDENLFIDLDADGLNEITDVMQACTRREMGEDIPVVEITDRISDNIAKSKAAIYRFYSKISVGDGKYVLAPCTAGDLRMTEEIFNMFIESLEDMNESIRLQNEAGMDVDVTPITEEYLNSLLE